MNTKLSLDCHWKNWSRGIFRFTLSIYRRWRGTDHCTWRYVSAALVSPVLRGNDGFYWNYPRLGRHVDIHGRVYWYFLLLYFYQDVWRGKTGRRDFVRERRLLGFSLVTA